MAKMIIEIKNGELVQPTSPDLKDLNNAGTSINGSGTFSATKSFIALNSIKNSTKAIGQSIIDSRFSISENGLSAKKLSIAQEIIGVGITTAINPILGGIQFATSIATKSISYNTEIQKANIKAQYIANKYNISSSSGGRK